MSQDAKEIRFPDGRSVTIYQPDVARDLDKLVAFLSGLPTKERNNMRYNVTDKKYGAQRVAMVDGIDHWRLVAETDGSIVGDATMDRSLYSWTRHVADLRCAVDSRYDALGLRVVLLKELVEASSIAGIERLCSEVLDSQPELMESLQDLGFTREVVRTRYAKDLAGAYHDVVIMSNDREAVWERLSDMMAEMDGQYARVNSAE
jgi:hypothetical protein